MFKNYLMEEVYKVDFSYILKLPDVMKALLALFRIILVALRSVRSLLGFSLSISWVKEGRFPLSYKALRTLSENI